MHLDGAPAPSRHATVINAELSHLDRRQSIIGPPSGFGRPSGALTSGCSNNPVRSDGSYEYRYQRNLGDEAERRHISYPLLPRGRVQVAEGFLQAGTLPDILTGYSLQRRWSVAPALL